MNTKELLKQLPIDIMAKIAEDFDTETLSIAAFSFYEHRHGPFSTQLLSRIERLRAFCSLLRDTCRNTKYSLLIDPSRVLPYHADKVYWNERDFRLVATVFMENKLFTSHVIVYVAAMWGYTDYAEQLVKDSKSRDSGDMKAFMYHGAGMGGDVSFKAQEIKNDLCKLVDYSNRLRKIPLSLHPNAIDLTPSSLNCSWVMAYMHGLICRGYAPSNEGRYLAADLYARFSFIPFVYGQSRCAETALRIMFFAALLSGDRQYADGLRFSTLDQETVISLELLAALQLRREQEALELLEVLLQNNRNRFWELDPFPADVLQCAVRQQLDVFVQAYLDKSEENRREDAIKCILRTGSDDFIARLRLGGTAGALKGLNQEKRAAFNALRSKWSFLYFFSPYFEGYAMGLEARRGLQLRYGPDADIDEIYTKADCLAYARIMQQRPRRSEKQYGTRCSEKIRVKQNMSASLVLYAGLVLAVSAVCAMANTSGMRLST